MAFFRDNFFPYVLILLAISSCSRSTVVEVGEGKRPVCSGLFEQQILRRGQ